MHRLAILLVASSSTAAALSPTKTPPPTPAWLTGQLSEFDLQIRDFPDTGRGLQTTCDRCPGEVLIRVLEGDALTASSMLDRFPLLARAAKTSPERSNNGNKLSDEQILAVGLLLLREEGHPYAISLPPQLSVLQMPDQFLMFMPEAYRKLIQAYRQHCSELRESIVAVLPEEHAKLVSEEAFRWAFATVRSRCVGIDGEDDDDRVGTRRKGEVRVLLPGFDLLNHKFGANSTPGFHMVERVYFVQSNDAYAANDQVFISYGDHRDNLQMLMTYGFVAPGNPHPMVHFDGSNLLDALAAARPDYFSAPVLRQLWSLMTELGKHRDLYAWDGRTRRPHESLSDGIAMMAEIEKQFLKLPDESFSSDVLASLIAARRRELALGMERMEQATTSSADKPWAPLMESIKLLLAEEENCLTEDDDFVQRT